ENRGRAPLVSRGPGRTVLRCRVSDDAQGETVEETTTDLAEMILPGRTATAAVLVRAPKDVGEDRVCVRLATVGNEEEEEQITLTIESVAAEATELRCLTLARQALAAAHEAQRLPDDYVDVTEGWFARLKRWVKRKLLGNFKRAYVDVL